jgi:hypothetical protein
MRFGETELDPRDAAGAVKLIERMEEGLVRISAPTPHRNVIDVIRMIAETVQVDMPEDMGLTVYVAILEHLPSHVLSAAAIEILTTHSVRVLPLPAEILATNAVQEWIIVEKHWPNLCAQWRRRLEKISTAKGD